MARPEALVAPRGAAEPPPPLHEPIDPSVNDLATIPRRPMRSPSSGTGSPSSGNARGAAPHPLHAAAQRPPSALATIAPTRPNDFMTTPINQPKEASR